VLKENPDIVWQKCTKCGRELPATLEFFSAKKTCKDGLNSYCKSCKSLEDRNYREKNADKISLQRREKYKQNPESFSERNKKQYQIHKEKRTKYDRNYYLKNKSKVQTRTKKYYQEHREEMSEKKKLYWNAHLDKMRDSQKIWNHKNKKKVDMYKQKYRTRRAEADFDFTFDDWEDCKDYFNQRCCYCGCKPKVLHKEHVIPLSKGGTTTVDNILPACGSCNSSKHDLNLKIWYRNQPFFNQLRYLKIRLFLISREITRKTADINVDGRNYSVGN
jgi:hypothetical protein